MKSLLSPLLIGIVVCLSANSSGAATRDCTSTREFVTALEFLRSWKESAVPERDAQAVALKVAAGCTGAAERFIKVTSSLAQSGVGASDAIKAGLDFVARTSVEADTFTLVFVRAFSSEGLDLDLRSSLELARSLSTEFQGNSLGVRDDFEKIIRFCVSEKDLDLPRPQCATLSARLAARTGLERRSRGSVSRRIRFPQI